MSVRDINKVMIITNGLTGDVIEMISLDLYSPSTINIMLNDLIDRYILDNENGLIIKVGYNN